MGIDVVPEVMLKVLHGLRKFEGKSKFSRPVIIVLLTTNAYYSVPQGKT